MKKVIVVVFLFCLCAFAALTKLTSVQLTNSTIDNSPIGATTPSTGAFTTATASGGFTGALTGNASTASALAATPTLCTGGQLPTGILANGNATGCTSLASSVQTASATGCTTGSSSFSTCSTFVTWPSAFPDTSYKVTCVGINPSNPRASINGVAKSTSGVTVTTVTNGSVGVNYSELDCMAK